MIATPRLQIHWRPLSEAEGADLERQAAEAMEREKGRLRRWGLAMPVVTGLVAAIYAALWMATFQLQLDLTRTIVSTVASFALLAGLVFWERRRLAKLRADWAKRIAEAAAYPLLQTDVEAERAWFGEPGWIFELGDGHALFADWDFPQDQPRARISWRQSQEGFHWLEQSGSSLPVGRFVIDWETLPDSHPLAKQPGPALFRLDSGDPAEALLAFREGSFPALKP